MEKIKDFSRMKNDKQIKNKKKIKKEFDNHFKNIHSIEIAKSYNSTF